MRLLVALTAAAAAGAVIGNAVGRAGDQESHLHAWQAGFLAGSRQAKRTRQVSDAAKRAIHPSRFLQN
jgi:3-deoxy-D-arabino-heptulosonate 7-phosphate (DAHP) synthase class II